MCISTLSPRVTIYEAKKHDDYSVQVFFCLMVNLMNLTFSSEKMKNFYVDFPRHSSTFPIAMVFPSSLNVILPRAG